MNFELTEEQIEIQMASQNLARDFATRRFQHDRDATNPIENYELLKAAEFHILNIPKELGGRGEKLFFHSLVVEQLARGCPATALSCIWPGSVFLWKIRKSRPTQNDG